MNFLHITVEISDNFQGNFEKLEGNFGLIKCNFKDFGEFAKYNF